MSYASNAARLKARMPKHAEPSGAVIASVVLVFLIIILLAVAVAIVPPILAAVLWFPALGLTGWPLFWASVGGFAVWFVILRLIDRLRD